MVSTCVLGSCLFDLTFNSGDSENGDFHKKIPSNLFSHRIMSQLSMNISLPIMNAVSFLAG